VVIPSNPADAYGLLRGCIADPDPCIFVEPLGIYWVPGPAPVRGTIIPLGKAQTVRSGNDVTVITYGRQVADVVAVANALAADVSIEIIDLRTVAPYDETAILESVGRTGRAVIVHEAVRNFGVGAEIAAMIMEKLFDSLKAPVGRVGGKFSPVPFSQPLEAAFVPSQTDIIAAIRATLR
jgi:pyruvate dehydrogenase E1 component beta subunit